MAPQIVVATPGRFTRFPGAASSSTSASVRILVLDEADRMLDMGFLPAIKRIMPRLPTERQTLFFSATIESRVKQLVERHVRDPVRIELGSITKPCRAGGPALLRSRSGSQIRPAAQDAAATRQGSFLVFTRTKHGAEKLAKKLAAERLEVAPPSTATAARISATRRSRASRTATTASSSPPTWPPAASTSKTSRMS